MALTDDQIKTIKTWVGDDEWTYENLLNERYTRLDEDLDRVIIEILNEKIVAAQSDPQSISLPGGMTISFGDAAATLERHLKRFLDQGGTDGIADEGKPALTISRMTRIDYR